MLEPGKINNFELITLLTLFLLGSTLIFAPGIGDAGQDTWFALLLGMALAFPFLYLYIKLGEKFPGMTIVEYSQVLLGNFLGKLVGAIYVWFAFQLGVWVLRNFVDFISITTLVRTPPEFLAMAFTLLAAYGVTKGLEVIACSTQFMLPIVIVAFLLITIFMLGEMDFTFLLPILNIGSKELFLATLANFSFPFTETIVFTMVFPYLQDQEKAFAAAGKGVLLAGAILFVKTLLIVTVFRPEVAATMIFPFYNLARLISIAGFLERFDPMIVGAFILTGFVKISVCYYAAVLGLGQLLGLKDYKPLILPIGALMVAFSLVVFPNMAAESFSVARVSPFYTFPIKVIIPLLLFLVAVFRKNQDSGK